MQAIPKRLQRIWIVSPDFWGSNFLSKHNYAIEFSKRGYEVFFIEPSKKDHSSITVSESGFEHLFIVSNGFYVKGQNRLPYWLKALLFRFIFSMMAKKIQQPDIVLSFDSINYKSLSLFNAAYNVQFFVDLNYNYPVHIGLLKADLLLTVSTTIQDWFKQKGYSKVPIMLGHGLNAVFAANAERTIETMNFKTSNGNKNSKIRLAYFGSLFQSILDKKHFLEIITKYPQIQFDIIGPNNLAELNQGGMSNSETVSFIEALKNLPNVFLYGTLKPSSAVEILNACDGYLFLWKNEGIKDVGNSHKILEYLSFGKAVYSTIEFELYKGLLCTTASYSFDSFIKKLHDNNGFSEQVKRINFALDNTYKSKVAFIEKQVQMINPKKISALAN